MLWTCRIDTTGAAAGHVEQRVTMTGLGLIGSWLIRNLFAYHNHVIIFLTSSWITISIISNHVFYHHHTLYQHFSWDSPLISVLVNETYCQQKILHFLLLKYGIIYENQPFLNKKIEWNMNAFTPKFYCGRKVFSHRNVHNNGMTIGGRDVDNAIQQARRWIGDITK